MIDRHLFSRGFSEDSQPAWPCPRCGSPLRLRKKSFSRFETADSKRKHRNSEFGPWDVEYVFSAVFECCDGVCAEKVTVCGSGRLEPDYERSQEGDTSEKWDEWFLPEYFHPHLRLFRIPESAPEDVKKELLASFNCFFADSDSSGNRLRCAIENLLDHFGVPRISQNSKKKKAEPIALHNRIDMIPDSHTRFKNRLWAIKWLGNSASHSDSALSKNDVLNGYEIFEEVLREIFEPSRTEEIAANIIQYKGPEPRKRLKRLKQSSESYDEQS